MSAPRQAAPGATESHPPHGTGFAHFANLVAHLAGRPVVFALCCTTIVLWAVSGPVFRYSDSWQLIINTGTTIITFLMVFLIQNTQNRDGAAMQAKLDELIRVTRAAHDALIRSEDLSETQLEEIRKQRDEPGNDDRPPHSPPHSPPNAT
jgi:low affinity Fe/Cu permease